MTRQIRVNVTTGANLTGLSRLQASMQRLNLSQKRMQTGFVGVSGGINSLNASSSRATSTIRRMGTALLFFAGAGAVSAGFKALVRTSLNFNRSLETSQLSIAALIASSAKVVDEQGNMLSPAQAFAAATVESKRQMALLRKETLLTSASFEELANAYQVAVAPGLQAGMNLDDIRLLSRRISQAATTLGMEQRQLPEEIRSLLQGTIRKQSTRIATVLNINNDDIKRWKEAGTLSTELFKRFDAFQQAEGKLADTFSGLLGRMNAAMSFALGKAGEQFFGQIKDTFREMIDFLVVIDEKGVRVNDKVLATMKLLFTAIGDVVSYLVTAFKSLDFESAFSSMEGIAGAVRSIGRFVVDAVVGIGRAFVLFGKLSSMARGFAESMWVSSERLSLMTRLGAQFYTLWLGITVLLSISKGLTTSLFNVFGALVSLSRALLVNVLLTRAPMIAMATVIGVIAKIFNDVTQELNGTAFSYTTQIAALFGILEAGAKQVATVVVNGLTVAYSAAKFLISFMELGFLSIAKAALFLANNAVAAFKAIKDVGRATAQTIGLLFNVALGWIERTFKSILLGLLKGYREIEILQSIVTGNWDPVARLDTAILNLSNSLDTAKKGAINFREEFNKIGKASGEWKTDLFPELSAAIDKRFEEAKSGASKKANELTGVVQKAWEDTKAKGEKTWEEIWASAGDALDKGGKQAIEDRSKALITSLGDVLGEVSSKLSDLGNKASGAGAGYESLAERAKAALAEVQQAQDELGKSMDITAQKQRAAYTGPESFYMALQKGFEGFVGNYQSILESVQSLTTGFVTSLSSFISDSIVKAFDPTEKTSLKERFARFLQELSSMIIKEMIKWAIMKAALGLFGGFQSVPGAPTATAPGAASGGRIRRGRLGAAHFSAPQGLAMGGRPKGLPSSDTVPIWATPGEFMMKVGAVRKYGENALAAINAGLVNPMALRGLTQTAGASARPAAPKGGFATGGEVRSSDTVPVSGPSGFSQAVIVANDEAMDSLLSGGKGAMFKFMKDHKSTLKGILK